MPLEWRLQVLEARVRERWGEAVAIESLPVDDLEPEESSRLLAAVYGSGEDFPVALVGEAVVCMSGLDPFAVLAALQHCG